MTIRSALFLTPLLQLGAFFMVRSGESFVEGIGYGFLLGAIAVQVDAITRFLIARVRQRSAGGHRRPSVQPMAGS